MDEILGDIQTDIIPQEIDTLEKCLKTSLEVLINLDPKYYQRE